MTAQPTRAQALFRLSPDVALGALLLLIIALMIVPVPTPLLDVLIASNIALSVVMLLVAIAVRGGLGFTAMPTVLLVTTLYRLALNVSSTRLILLQADAGRVIEAFGEYVVRGNYAVGGVVFFVLTLIQYVVIARGSERVAEVGARFTLDAMPGKQMAIDADLRAGTRTPDDAREARRQLERENQFYGAMDGAMKFVKGDAIAGMVIIVVNIVAGVGIGVGMRGLDVFASLRTYGLLTIGDGLVCQIPALLISTSAGLVVTRVASQTEGSSLGSDVRAQLFGNARALWMAAAFLALLACVPGLPALPFGTLALLLCAIAYSLRTEASGTSDGIAPPIARFERLAPVSVSLGMALAPLSAELEALRVQLTRELGVPLGPIAIQQRAELPPRAYRLELSEVPRAAGELLPEFDARQSAHHIRGELGGLLRMHAPELLGLQESQQLLDALERSAPALVHGVVPRPVTLPLLTEVLRGLLAEGISIRPLPQILEALAQPNAPSQPAKALEHVRLALRRHILAAHTNHGTVQLHPVDCMIEDALRDAAAPGGLPLSPDQARDITEAVRKALPPTADGRALLITQPDVRAHLRRLLEVELPRATVISYPELVPELRVQHGAPVRIGH